MLDVLRRWRENYYASRVLSSLSKPVERSCRAISHGLRSHVPRNGMKFRLPNGQILRMGRDSGIYLASGLFWGGLDSFEPHTSRTLRFFFSRAASFVDVGANYGFYSLLAAHWNPNLQVVAFEPVPQIFERLNRNIELNGLQQRIRSYCLALSDRSGPAKLYVPRSESRDFESTATLAQGNWQQRKGSPSLDLEAVSFGDFEKQHGSRLEIVKIDVEDHEANVLQGMQAAIQRDRPFIVCEILSRSHGNERTREIINALGYTAYWVTPYGYIRVSRFDFDRESEDFLLSPVSTDAEVVTDLNALWNKRTAAVAA
jgi:FkbM family methyltransferase